MWIFENSTLHDTSRQHGASSKKKATHDLVLKAFHVKGKKSGAMPPGGTGPENG
jgi:hypothetical protein